MFNRLIKKMIRFICKNIRELLPQVIGNVKSNQYRNLSNTLEIVREFPKLMQITAKISDCV